MPFIISLFLSFSAFSLEIKGKDGPSFEFVTIASSHVSPLCQKSCKALDDYTKKASLFKSKGANPASELCHYLGGKEQTLVRAGGEDGACFFSDGSYILSWDLFRRHGKTLK